MEAKYVCPVCRGPKWSNGDRPCRTCDRIGSRKPRPCEVCETTYKPSHSLQRTCSRACGTKINAVSRSVTMALRAKPQASRVDWHPCPVCGALISKPKRRLCGSRACSLEDRRASDQAQREVKAARRRHVSSECPTCGAEFTHAGTARYCSQRCTRKAAKLRCRVAEAGSFGTWTWSDFMRMARRFDYCCAYCGEKPDRLDPDHVLPLSRGGPNVIANLLPTCLLCNSDKGARTLPEWEAWRLERGKPPRKTTWHPKDSRYLHLSYGIATAA